MRTIKVKITCGIFDCHSFNEHAKRYWQKESAEKQIPRRLFDRHIEKKVKIYLLFVLQYYGHNTQNLKCGA